MGSNSPHNSQFHDGPGDFELPRERFVALIRSLAEAAGAHVDHWAVSRALEDACAGDSPAEAPSAQEAVSQLEYAAERLALRVLVQRISLADGLRFARQHKATALLSLTDPSQVWAVVTGSSWRKVQLALPDGSSEWCSASQVAAKLGVDSPQSDVCIVTASVTDPYEDHGHSSQHHDAHGAGGADEQGHGQGHGQRHGHGRHGMSPLRRLLGILRPEAGDIAVVAVFSAVVGLLALASPIAVEALVNTVAFGRFAQPVVVLCLILLTFLAFAALLRVLQAYVSEIIQRRIFVRVVSDLAYRLPRVRQSALDDHHGPELLNRFFDVMTVQKTAAVLVLDGISIVLQTIIGMVVLAIYHPYLLGFDVFLVGSLAVIVFVLGRGGVRTAINESLAKYRVAAWLEELVGAPLAFKMYGGSRRAWDVADRFAADYVRARSQHFRVVLRQIIFAAALQAVGSAVLLGIGGWLVIEGDLSLGQLVAAELIVAVILGSTAKLGKHLESYYDLLAAVDKIGHLFDLPVERPDGAAPAARLGPAALSLRRVGLRLGERTVLQPVSASLAPGELAALVGPPGAGKSMLLDILYALRLPTAGRVEYDGVDVRSLQRTALRREVTLVRDGREVFSGTIAENVHLDRAGIGFAEVRDVLEEIGLLDELLELPAGLETRLSPLGTPLSDSQVRRMLLARALVGRPRLLLIDELLDALPTETLQQTLEALRRFTATGTVLLVTGRDDIMNACGRSIVIQPDRTPEAPKVALSGQESH
ncbi:MAG: ATP-binding cassette domain-containing protein [Pirellulales bacterium]